MSSAKNFFSEEEKTLIIDAIQKAEKSTSGEIRIHLENFCFGNEVKRAQRVFTNLKMHQTKERNGVLIYLAIKSKKVAVIGDEGIHQKLGDKYWQDLVQQLIAKLKANKKAEGLAESILECGRQLSTFFPHQANDSNELSNSISY